jgi:hypothetical protein
MIQKDYIMRLIKQFFEAVERLIKMKSKEHDRMEIQTYLNEMYDTFLKKSGDFYHSTEIEEIIQSFKNDEKEPMLEILSELLYQDALLRDNQHELLIKALKLNEYMQEHSATFSFNRQLRIDEIKKMLSCNFKKKKV